MSERPTIISIFGPSGSGKSQLAKAVAAVVGEERCARIPTDYFLNLPSVAATNASGQAHEAIMYDWVLVDRILDQPLGTTVTTPDVDFDRLVRRSPAGGLPFIVRPIMVTDAFVPHPAASVRIRLTASEQVRRARVIDRDTRWGSRVIDRWEHLETTWNEVAHLSSTPDLYLSGEDPIEHNAALVAAVLSRSIEEAALDPR